MRARCTKFAMTPELLAKYDSVRVPRYTSYPTAPHFTDAVGAQTYGEWLAAIPVAASLSLYLHIPFCRSICWYCGCHTKAVARYQPVASYLDALMTEIARVAALLPADPGPTVRHIHWGGGTPTILTPADFLAVSALLRRAFTLADEAEIAVEIDPRTLTPELAEALAQAGVNRASLGVQDFDACVQELIHRPQPYQVVADAVACLRAVGITALNFDLMYGLPGQTPASCAETASQALGLGPDRLAVFGYAHVPWMKRNQTRIDEATLPSAVERWQQFAEIGEVLAEGGFVPVGLDHFAAADDPLVQAHRSGRLTRNFQGYTTDTAAVLLGFGASAIGALPQGYVQNATPIGDYQDAIAAGRLATTRGRALAGDDRLRRAIIERLMCDLSVDVGAIAEAHGADPTSLDSALAALAAYEADGLAVRSGRHVTVPDSARPLVRLVAAAFDQYLTAGETRHAKAV